MLVEDKESISDEAKKEASSHQAPSIKIKDKNYNQLRPKDNPNPPRQLQNYPSI